MKQFAWQEALTRMYEEAEPPLDFEEVLDDPESVDNDWYKQHYLSSERQQEIVSEIEQSYDLTLGEKTHLKIETILNYAPTSNPDLVESVDAPADEQ